MKILIKGEKMTFLELSIKIIFSVIALLLCVFVIRWFWTHQIDPVETVKRWLGKAEKPVEWIATRDPNAIYQNGQIVGNVSGEVEETDGKMVFQEICDTSSLDRDSFFEYRRGRYEIISIGHIIGQEILMTDKGTEIKKAVLKNIQCKKIK